jgi:uncharacterized protein (TIGR03435 family)
MYQAILFSALMATSALAQSPAPAFEVASIKISPQFMNWSGFRSPGAGRFEASHATLRAMAAYAYDVRDFYVSGGPGWAGTDRFEIEAKAEDNATPAQMRLLLRALLEERFKLTVHRETKEATVYQLVAVKGGPKLQEGRGDGFISFGGRGEVSGHGATTKDLAGYLQTLLGQPVLDKTGLAGKYDFKLTWTPDETQTGRPGAGTAAGGAANESGPAIFTALQEQLGLKLESAKAPVEMLVIDRAEKPSEN